VTDRSHLPRRQFLRAALGLAAVGPIVPATAWAQADYPRHPIRILIGTPPGDTVDGWTRQLVVGLGASLGQPVIVENKPGAHGMIVGNAAKVADKDGYTLLVSTGGPMSINPSVYGSKLTYDPLKDFAAIGHFTKGALYLYCNNDLPVTNLKEMVAYVKARPGKISYGSGGTGTTQHLSMEILKKATGMDMVHVPYKGSPMVLQDVIGGQIPFAFDAGGSLLPQVRSGKVRVLAVSTATRSSLTPDIPTLVEQGVPGFDTRVWAGLFAPAGTPEAIIARLNKDLNQAIQAPKFVELLRVGAAEPWSGSAGDMSEFLKTDIERWRVVVREANVKPE